jgi:RHS repeat-associated protein
MYDSPQVEREHIHRLHQREGVLSCSKARYYNPSVARFVSEDALASFGTTTDPLSLNAYTYSENEPIQYIDPLGLTRRKSGPRRRPPQPLDCETLKTKVGQNNQCKKFPEKLTLCIILKESGGVPDAKNRGSSASGLMQLTRSTAKQVKCERSKLFDPDYNIRCGTKYLCWIMDNFTGGDIAKTVRLFKTGPSGGGDEAYGDDIENCFDCFIFGGCCSECNPNQ